MRAIALAVLVIAASAVTMPSRAEESPAKRAQACDKQATLQKLGGDKRTAFMKSCLASDLPASETSVTGAQLMKQCSAAANAQALAGEERRRFIDGCVKKVPTR